MTTNTDFVQYDADNLLAINARNHNDGLGNYRHRTKPAGYADAYNYNQHLGYSFYMDVVIDSNQNILDLYCPPDATSQNTSGYDATLKTLAGASVHVTNIQEYYCDYKFYEIPVRYEIRLKQMPVYTLIDSEDANEAPIDISDPVTLEYTVPANTEYNFSNQELTGDDNENLEGRKYKLQFEGFGNLYNIPGRVVDVCNDTVIGKYTDNWNNNCYRYVHDFVIPDGAILKEYSTGTNYLKVKALRGDEYLEKTTFAYDDFAKGVGDVPGDDDLQNIFSLIGTAPDITHPAAESDKAAVVHGVTVHPATP